MALTSIKLEITPCCSVFESVFIGDKIGEMVGLSTELIHADDHKSRVPDVGKYKFYTQL